MVNKITNSGYHGPLKPKLGDRLVINKNALSNALTTLAKQKVLFKFWGFGPVCPVIIDSGTGRLKGNTEVIENIFANARSDPSLLKNNTKVTDIDILEIKCLIINLSRINVRSCVFLSPRIINVTSILYRLRSMHPQKLITSIGFDEFHDCVGENIDDASKRDIDNCYPSQIPAVQAAEPEAKPKINEEAEMELKKLSGLFYEKLMVDIDEAARVLEDRSEETASAIIDSVINEARSLDDKSRANILLHIKDVLSAMQMSDHSFRKTPAYNYLIGKTDLLLRKLPGYGNISWQSVWENISKAIEAIEIQYKQSKQKNLLNIPSIHPLSGQIYYWAGRTMQESNEIAKAREYYQKALNVLKALNKADPFHPLIQEISNAINGIV